MLPDLPDSTDGPDRPSPVGRRASMLLFALIAALMAVDLVLDYRHDLAAALQSFELLVFLFALAGLGFNWRRMMAAQRRSERLDRELAEARAEAYRWSEDARRWSREAQGVLEGLGAAMDRQFDRWGLTPAEREVAVLQLKGLRHKAIAELRDTSERTVRQQALSIYRKSGLNGRSDLAAFFLEGLLLPQDRHASALPSARAAASR